MRETIDLSGPGWRLWLDADASWKDDELHLSPVDIGALPVNEPTGGWQALDESPLVVHAPGTVEQHYWDQIGDYIGVSWWSRRFDAPADLHMWDRFPTGCGRRAILRFEAVRLRAEVFVNRRLVGYDAVGNTPFEADVTEALRPGEANDLAVRVTDPGGNFTWVDPHAHEWGGRKIPASHGFGGITGPVRLLIVPEAYVADVFVRNKPSITDIDVEITVRNTTREAARRHVRIEIRKAGGTQHAVLEQSWPHQTIEPGEHIIRRSLSLPHGRTWDLDTPHLYICRVIVGDDAADVRFGLRWFAADGIGDRAVFRLNGRRIVLRSAISWGFWPVNGIFPTPELCERNVRAAKALGLNMLNFHRCIGQPATLDKADELGLLIHEEPGGYFCLGGDDLAYRLAREKLLRMVRRDRNHPSLVIYNMINESTEPPDGRHRRDMADAHALDPTRVITYTSGWAKDGDDPIKLHMRPYDDQPYTIGWFDHHHATGPGVYRDEFYAGPEDHRWHTTNRGEIVFWGEEGAVAAPPQLGSIVRELADGPNGWDGADYRAWHAAFERYLDEKDLRGVFPTVDDLARRLGDVTYYYHGRVIENVRLDDCTDGYVINGWECEKIENHSGVVDCWRHFKGDPALLARYNAPLYVAVKLRRKVGPAPFETTVDFFIVNERNLHGPHNLVVKLIGPDLCGTGFQPVIRWTNTYRVNVTGGDTFGELLVGGVDLQAGPAPGRYRVEALLVRPDQDCGTGISPVPTHAQAGGHTVVARGDDELFLVRWSAPAKPTRVAIVEHDGVLRRFLEDRLGIKSVESLETLPAADCILVGRFDPMPLETVPTHCLRTPDGGAGLAATYFQGTEFQHPVLTRVDPNIDFHFDDRGPDPSVGGRQYSVRWEGRLRAAESGPHRVRVISEDGARAWLDGRRVYEQWDIFAPRFEPGPQIELEAGRDYELRVEHFQYPGGASVRLCWSTPSTREPARELLKSVLERVRDGATAVFLDQADDWAFLLHELGAVRYGGCLNHGRCWLGGSFFAARHPLLDGLPQGTGLNWEYQELVYDGAGVWPAPAGETRAPPRRFGLVLEGEQVTVGCVTGHEHVVATAVGVVPFGRGRIVLSTLDILPVLNEPAGPADVARKLLCNYLAFATGSSQETPP